MPTPRASNDPCAPGKFLDQLEILAAAIRARDHDESDEAAAGLQTGQRRACTRKHAIHGGILPPLGCPVGVARLTCARVKSHAPLFQPQHAQCPRIGPTTGDRIGETQSRMRSRARETQSRGGSCRDQVHKENNLGIQWSGPPRSAGNKHDWCERSDSRSSEADRGECGLAGA